MDRFRLVFKQRKYYYFVCYIAGYLLMLSETGVPSWIYLVPLKVTSFGFAMTMGNVAYYGWVEKENPIIGMLRIVKWLLALIILFLIMIFIQTGIQAFFNIDIGPAFGI